MKCKRSGETGQKFVRCPNQVCNVCSGKGHAPGICGNNVTALACVGRSSRNDDSGADVSSKDAEAFMCDASGKFSGVSSESDEEDYRELPWQRRDVPAI